MSTWLSWRRPRWLGNIFAIICAGFLARMGARRPALSGNGMLIRSHEDNSVFAQNQSTQPTDFQLMGAGLLMICAFSSSAVCWKVVHIPGPVLMISGGRILANIPKLSRRRWSWGAQLLQVRLRRAGVAADDRPWACCMYRWRKRGLGLPLATVVVCGSIVIAMALKAVLYRFTPEYVSGGSRHCQPAAIAGLGGTGDVAISRPQTGWD